MARLRAVLLDAGGTLIHPDHEFLLQLLADEGVDADLEAYEAARRKADAVVADILRSEDPGTDETRARAWFGSLLVGLGLPESRLMDVARKIRQRHLEANLWVRPVPGTRAMLERLRDSGLRLAVISNADGSVDAYLENAGLADLFDFILDSAREGVEKPDPGIFETALERLDLAPDETVYVGDTWNVDVEGARGVGIRPIYLAESDAAVPEDAAPVTRIRSILELPEVLGREADASAHGERRER